MIIFKDIFKEDDVVVLSNKIDDLKLYTEVNTKQEVDTQIIQHSKKSAHWEIRII